MVLSMILSRLSAAPGPRAAGDEAPADGASPSQDPAEEVTDVVEDSVPQDVQTLVTAAGPFWGLLIGVGISVVVALAITLATSLAAKQILRRLPSARRAVDRTRLPLFFVLLMIGARISVAYALGDRPWQGPLGFVLVVLVIAGLAWWALRIVGVVEAVVLAHYGGDGEVDDRRGRRVQTQVSLIRRVLAAVIITVAVAAMLLLIPQVRALGAGLLASAGVLSVVAGIAMQSTLANVFAGVQLAFTDTIRVGDVIVVEDNFATVEDITLSVVVLKVWDDRRIIYPSSYFVATPFENWTRVGTQLMGTVELDVDWRVPMDAIRGRLKRLLDSTDLWDGRDYGLQVTDASAGMVKIWVVLSARNSAELWDLRCLVREDLVNYLRAEHPYAVLTQRMLISHDEALSLNPSQVRTGAFDRLGAEAETDAATDAAADAATDAETASAAEAPAEPGGVPGGVSGGASGGAGPARREGAPETSGPDSTTSPETSPETSSETPPTTPPATAPLTPVSGARPTSDAASGEHPDDAERAEPAERLDTDETPLAHSGEGASLFTGSIAAIERGREFSGPGEGALRERRERQEVNVGLEVETSTEPAAGDAATQDAEDAAGAADGAQHRADAGEDLGEDLGEDAGAGDDEGAGEAARARRRRGEAEPPARGEP